MNPEDELRQMKRMIAEAERDESISEGRIETHMERLKQEGCKSLEEAEAEQKKLSKRIKRAQDTFDKKMKALKGAREWTSKE